jgi:hypothetical protein
MMQLGPKPPFIRLEHSKNQIHNDRAYMENIMHVKGPVFLLSEGITDYSHRICIAVQQAMCIVWGHAHVLQHMTEYAGICIGLCVVLKKIA